MLTACPFPLAGDIGMYLKICNLINLLVRRPINFATSIWVWEHTSPQCSPWFAVPAVTLQHKRPPTSRGRHNEPAYRQAGTADHGEHCESILIVKNMGAIIYFMQIIRDCAHFNLIFWQRDVKSISGNGTSNRQGVSMSIIIIYIVVLL